MCNVCGSLFVLLFPFCWPLYYLSVLRFTASYYSFWYFKLLLSDKLYVNCLQMSLNLTLRKTDKPDDTLIILFLTCSFQFPSSLIINPRCLWVVYGYEQTRICGGAMRWSDRKSHDRKSRDRKWRKSRDRKWLWTGSDVSHPKVCSAHAQPEFAQRFPRFFSSYSSSSIKWTLRMTGSTRATGSVRRSP